MRASVAQDDRLSPPDRVAEQDAPYWEPGPEPDPGGAGRARGALATLRGLFEPARGVLPQGDGVEAVDYVLAAHQKSAVRVQTALRVVVILVVAVEFAAFPPRERTLASLTITACYGIWGVALLIAAWRDTISPRAVWTVPLVDLPVLTIILMVSGTFTDPGWSTPFSADAYVLIPVLAAFQLRPRITAVAGAAATVVYGTASGIGHSHAGPDLQYTLTHALLIAVVSVACVLISWIQQSRVAMIADLAHHRSWLLAHTMSAGERDRRQLSEALHDGPLQSVLVARQDVAEAEGEVSHDALRRADEALQDASRLLRSQVTELHPAVLDHAGLEQALRGLTERAARRARFTVRLECDRPSTGHDTDRLLFHCARELIANIVKHAHARKVEVRLTTGLLETRLEIADDGVGLPEHVLSSRVAQGHIGLASQRIRIEDAGGTLAFRPNTPHGTVVVVTLPVEATELDGRSAA